MTDDEPGAPITAPVAVVAPMLAWAETELRDLPWRRTRDAWSVLVSEVMLQQTQVGRVIERHSEFLDRFPDAAACAAAPVSAVIELWSGLGYNRRAVNLWRCAAVIVAEFEGRVPTELDALLTLPGIGPYTARAVQVFAHERDVGVVDTNAGRLLARWTGRTLSHRQAQQLADELVPPARGWAWNQALFDFAVAVCTKRDPSCSTCPVFGGCGWQGAGSDPALASAGVSTSQGAFAGSERQVRGRIVDALRAGPMSIDDLCRLGRPGDARADLERIVSGLVRDGLAERAHATVRLPP